ncbi:MAG TPA: excinuclease ABC subunit UvrA [Candidatus Limnocylindrales bacterium]|nr:excinuclease ABC subunit UvrA [Candidatus Limnocylindrales bacterium]
MTEYIEIHGARENNLKDVSLRIPKRRITIFTGISGSGKSSIVFDTIATEAQRQLYENFSYFIRSFLPRYPQPDADAIANLSMAVIVDQKRMGGGSHSTVGTTTDIYTALRLLYSRIGRPHVGYANAFSFNDPAGMCPECNGTGRKVGIAVDDLVDMSKSLDEGAIKVPFWTGWEIAAYAASGFFDNQRKLRDYSKDELDLLLYGKDRKYKLAIGDKTMNATYLGVVEKIEQYYVRRDLKTLSERTQKQVEPYLRMQTCPLCGGARLSQAALSARVAGHSIAEMAAMEVGRLVEVVRQVDDPVAAPIVASLVDRLGHMVGIGLDYLSLDRETDTLSGGESQRVKLVKHLTSSLVDVMYILDEPSIGLHPRDVHLLTELLQKLRDKGNTVIVVEHDPDVMRVADHIVDMGPYAGNHGGEIVFEGSFEGLRTSDTLTGRFLDRSLPLKADVRNPAGWLPIRNARVNNLKGVDVDIPTGVLTVISGVAGSGKSSLIEGVFLPEHRDAIVIDQSAVGTSTRSNPATYTGVMDDIRKAFASANKVHAGLFSFNSKGACENCNGAGVIYTELSFLGGVKTPCEVCEGRRFKDDVLAYTLDGRNVSEVLALTVAEALEAFTQRDIVRKLQSMSDVGLDYLTLGQPLSTLSGGECQRIKLASELHRKGNVYVLDEPTTGLHMSDTSHLLEMLDRLVDGGNTVVVIEHNLDVIRNADWVIDLGPEGGTKGGRLIFSGTPADLLRAPDSLTAEYLRRAESVAA